MSDDPARPIGATHAVAGAGHEIRLTGQPINDALLAQWRNTATATAQV
jgi:hypothetical protein